MPIDSVESSRGTLAVDQTRARQTERPATPFRNALASGVNVLMTGAEVATSVVGGPVLAAAVHGARGDAVSTVAGAPPEGAGGGLSPDVAIAASGGGNDVDMAAVQAMQRESQTFNLQLLALQEEVQQENRRFSTVSNILRARHDTAKAAISNVRS
jgi:hypothetical protein